MQAYKTAFISVCFLFIFVSLPAATIDGECQTWHKITLAVEGPQTAEQAEPNPFLDYRMTVTFTGPSGQKFIVPGYFSADGNAANTSADSGNLWHAHLAPDRPGPWKYSVSFRTGHGIAVSHDPNAGSPVPGPDGQNGTFTIAPSDKTGRDFRAKGRLDYVEKHQLRFAGTGEYFLKCGADAPENLLAYAHFDGPFKSDGQKDNLVKTWAPHVRDWQPGDPTWSSLDGTPGTYGKGIIGAINYLASEGLNAFSFLPMNIEGDDRNVFPYTEYNERIRLDVSRLAQWEILFEHADKLGMYLHFKTQETENELLLDNGNLGIQRKLYYRELIARFAHHLALNWNLGEEINDADAAQKRAWAEYFHTQDPYHHPIVIHNGANHYELMGDPPGGSYLTGFSLQTGRVDFTDVHDMTVDYLNRSAQTGRPWVIACDEPGDATHALVPDSDTSKWDPNRNNARQNALWGNVMAGGAGLEWYFGYKHDHSDLTCQDFRSRDLFWDQCRYMLEFFQNNNIPFQDMTNDNNLTSNPNDYCLKKDGELYLVYLKSAGTTDITLPSGTFIIRWYNPRTGGGLQTGSISEIIGPGSVSIGNPPKEPEKDWLAVIRFRQ